MPRDTDTPAALAAGAVVEDADLTTTDPASLREALKRGHGTPWTFRRCTMDEVDLAGLDLTGAVLDRCRADGAVLRDAVLDGLRMDGGSLVGADLSGADLTDATFDGADLSRVRLVAAMLTDTTFRDCRMLGVDLSGLRSLAVTFSVDGCTLALANLSDAHLRAWQVHEADFSDADLRGADLREAVLDGCKLRGTDLTHARLDGADLSTADLGELTADTPAALRGAVISTDQAADICRALGLRPL